ncbi:MAG: hypothetical protein LC659_02160 [Myxococcales bacterium]|nr:hypothetical protein [Myxococcales bacterium]
MTSLSRFNELITGRTIIPRTWLRSAAIVRAKGCELYCARQMGGGCDTAYAGDAMTPLRTLQIFMPLDEAEPDAIAHAARVAGYDPSSVRVAVLRRSLDARKGHPIGFRLEVAIWPADAPLQELVDRSRRMANREHHRVADELATRSAAHTDDAALAHDQVDDTVGPDVRGTACFEVRPLRHQDLR